MLEIRMPQEVFSKNSKFRQDLSGIYLRFWSAVVNVVDVDGNLIIYGWSC